MLFIKIKEYVRNFKGLRLSKHCILIVVFLSFSFVFNNLNIQLIYYFFVFHRSEEGSQYLSHAEASSYCWTVGDIQLRWNALYGFRVVSFSLWFCFLSCHLLNKVLKVCLLPPACSVVQKLWVLWKYLFQACTGSHKQKNCHTD